jgi:predicted aminopeptidase
MIKNSLFILIILMNVSCAKLGYLIEQGQGQMSLQWRGIDNNEILNSDKISKDDKEKIALVGDYKKYFYSYFQKKQSNIYSKTTLLDNKAVTYLLISAKFDELEAQETKFPFVGSFPYLGFFNLDSAKDWARDLEQDGFVTWIRPVYAYSTLGYFEDRILSSFFHYNEYELAELIFHELFHTIFFLKNDVDFNESLATYFSDKLMREYFKNNAGFEHYLIENDKYKKLEVSILDLSLILKQEFKKQEGYLNRQRADLLIERFNTEVFLPKIKKDCLDLNLDKGVCEDNQKKWNQAQFAAFLTYEEELPVFERLQDKLKLNLVDFYKWIKKESKNYLKDDEETPFVDYLKKRYL